MIDDFLYASGAVRNVVVLVGVSLFIWLMVSDR